MIHPIVGMPSTRRAAARNGRLTAKIQLNDKNTKFEDLKENDEVRLSSPSLPKRRGRQRWASGRGSFPFGLDFRGREFLSLLIVLHGTLERSGEKVNSTSVSSRHAFQGSSYPQIGEVPIEKPWFPRIPFLPDLDYKSLESRSDARTLHRHSEFGENSYASRVERSRPRRGSS